MSRQQLAEALDTAFPLGLDARSILRAVTRLLARGGPVRARDLARALDWTVERVEAALATLSSCERDEDGDIIAAGLSLRRNHHTLEIGGRRLFAARTVDVLVLPAIIERAFKVSSTCTTSGARIRILATPLGLRECEPAGAVAFVPAPLHTSLRGLAADARLFRSKGEAEPWVNVGPRGALLPLKRAFEIGAEVGRRGFRLETSALATR